MKLAPSHANCPSRTKPTKAPHQRKEARARLEAGETQSDIARSYNADATTIGRLLR
jgi:hypothetical protein